MSDTCYSSETAQVDTLTSFAPCVLLIASLLVMVMCGGCARNIIRAKNLPPEYEAPHVENAQTIDLSKLSAPGVSNELIDRGDVLEVTITSHYGGSADDRQATSPVRVGDDGFANIPLVGRLSIAGLNLSAAEQEIAATSVRRGIFRDPLVTVTMLRQRMNKVTVLGAVENPGIYELPRGSSALLNAIVVAGGLSDEAGTEVELRRPGQMSGSLQLAQGGANSEILQQQQYIVGQPDGAARPTSTRIDLAQAAKEGHNGHYLNDGDLVMVQKRDPHPIHVIGLVRDPGEFELPINREMRVLDALAKAKGVSSQVANRVHVIRRIPDCPEPIVIQISLREAKTTGKGNLRLASEDVVSVEQTWATATYDTVNNFVRFGIGGTVPLF